MLLLLLQRLAQATDLLTLSLDRGLIGESRTLFVDRVGVLRDLAERLSEEIETRQKTCHKANGA